MNLQQIKNICTDIKSDDEWVCDSHDSAEHKGIIYGLDQLVKHLEEVSPKETDNNKDIALITSIIINEDMLGGTVFQTFDKAYELAKAFQKKYAHDFNWENQDLDFDEAIVQFVNSKNINSYG
jgi:hypothetical protein